MGFRLQQKSIILNDLERQFTAVDSVMRAVTKRLRLESRGFRYKVALYQSCLLMEIPSNFKHNLQLSSCVQSLTDV